MAKNENTDKKTRELDDAQKKAVSVDINSVVSAGAGSGKTTVLAERFSDLLVTNKDCKVEQILTLTFTKKATVEMNARIYKRLSEVCKDKAKDFYKANIKTIDSYCSQVAKLGCNSYGISPDFSLDDDEINQKVYDLALQFLLKYRDDPVFAQTSSGKQYDKIAQELLVDYANKYTDIVHDIDWERYFDIQLQYIKRAWSECHDNICKLTGEINELLSHMGVSKLKYLVTLIEKYTKIDEINISQINFDEYESEERSKFINAVYEFAYVNQNTGTNHDFDSVKQVHKMCRPLADALMQIENYIYGQQFVKKLIPYLKEFKVIVDDYKRTSGLLTYSDVSSLAVDILSNNPEIRKVEKEKYKFIMIDEFQDNNEVQKNLLFMLAEKPERMEKGIPDVSQLEIKKLFFVGDEKQSIYRFRGAEVSVFRGLAKDFAKGFLELKVNYRSHQALIAAFNTIFGGYMYPPDRSEGDNPSNGSVFYTTDDVRNELKNGLIIPSYEAVYSKVDISKSAQEEVDECVAETIAGKQPEIYSPRVTLAMINTKTDDASYEDEQDDEGSETSEYLSADESEAVWVTNKISELLEQGYVENDIAILFRAVSNQSYYEKHLLKKGISYKTEAVKDFFADGPVNDIISYLNLIAFKTDSYSFANLLHSSFVNLSFEEIEILMSNFDMNAELFSQDASGFLSKESLERYIYAQQFYIKAVEISQNETLAKLISFLWYEAGYRYETLLNKRNFMYNSDYDRIFELARKADVDGLGLSEFIDSLSQYKDEKLEGLNMPLEYSDGVNLLTIHKSKGLEYPVVFVVGCGNKTNSDKNGSLLYYSDNYGLTVNTPKSPACKKKNNFFYEINKELNKSMESAEYRRLIYVAITRAEQKVFISGKYNFDKWIPNPNEKSQSDKVMFNKGEQKPSVQPFIDILRPSLVNYLNKDMEIPSELIDRCPFVFEEISYVNKEEGYLLDTSKKKIIETFSPLFEKAEVIQKEVLQSPYAKPSQLYDEDDETYKTGSTVITVDKSIPYSEIDQLVKDSISSDKNEPDFAYNNFGTIAHSYLECAIKKVEPKMLNREIVGLHGNEKKIDVVDKTCRDMNDKFLNSDLGKLLLKTVEQNKFYKSEYTFKSIGGGKIINGQIDLVFENPNEEGYIVVDYKTNRKIEPENYYTQLACYKDAVSKMTGTSKDKIKCFLYYLRYAETRDITAECDEINLEELFIKSYN